MTELRTMHYSIPAADIGPENPLPMFRDPEDSQVHIDESVPEEDRARLGWRTGQRVLPHRVQDGYNRDRREKAFAAVVLENEFLRATVLPEVGGRLVSLMHKPDGRELLERNPVFQPANLALRNAWFSGGIEWNTSQYGHYYLTCSPVFAAQVRGSQGEPVLRLYEWDRVKCFCWQVDLHLPPGSPHLFARVRIINPHDHELPMYWWTNMAVPGRIGSRTLVPADSAIHNAQTGLAMGSLPEIEGVDASYPTNSQRARELFFRIREGQRPWITSLDADGRGLFQVSTSKLRGRKMFLWGMSPGGRRWQEYLSEPGVPYVEIQAGLARTQIESVPMPARAEWTWTEAFGLLEVDPALAHSPNWGAAVSAAEEKIGSVLPSAELDRLDSGFAAVTRRAPERVVATGSGWGALEHFRSRSDGIPGLPFEQSTIGEEQNPWIRLLGDGALPERSPQEEPGWFMVQSEWREMLERKLSERIGDHWLSWFHLGVMRMEAYDTAGARAAWDESLCRAPNAWALRCLGVLEAKEGRLDKAIELYERAWELGPRIAAIAIEYARLLLQAQRYRELRDLVQHAPGEVRNNDRIALMDARAAIELNELDGIEAIFDRDYASIREGEVTLTDLWSSLHDTPPPARIDFRM